MKYLIASTVIAGSFLAATLPRAQEPAPASTNAPTLILAPAKPALLEAPPRPAGSYNQVILNLIHTMPQGGGYSIKRDALNNFKSAINLSPLGESSGLDIMAETAKPSFCSEATYFIFIKFIQELLDTKQLQLSPHDIDELLVKGQPDGEGIWGRWNANGPGTARLFYELKLGHNFQSLAQAKPGDFLKLFWTDEIGAKEFGHSVIFLGTGATPEGGTVRIWSSNFGVGYSEKEVPIAKIKRMLFSRITDTSALKSISQLPKKDPYLASMLSNPTTEEEMSKMVGIDQKPSETGSEPGTGTISK